MAAPSAWSGGLAALRVGRRGAPGQTQSRTSGASSPVRRVGAAAQPLVGHVLAQAAARWARPGTRSITSMTRWNRSRSFSMTMSNGVVVVPSSLNPRTWSPAWLVRR